MIYSNRIWANNQRSVGHFLQLSIDVIRSFLSSEHIATEQEKFFYAILTNSVMFQEFCRSDGLGSLATFGTFRPPVKEYFFDLVWDKFSNNFEALAPILREWHCGVTVDNIHPCLTDQEIPNILSVFHLVAQCLCNDTVYFFSSLLTVSPV